ncbi:hypothetical protein [Ectothiorhodospira shaposhnikovii]|uniref:hypothetical protein n=1 Tax=Ectothiorhodospira shaposhnikovii TaxID=1054 RepID=UPI0039A2A925
MTEPKHEQSPPTAGAKPSAPASSADTTRANPEVTHTPTAQGSPATATPRRRRSPATAGKSGPSTRKPQPRTADTGYLPGRRVWPD